MFRTEDAPGGLTDLPLQIAQDGRGRYWVMVPGQLPLVFDRQGRFLREIGRRGGGPGEFLSAGRVTSLPGDSVLITDSGQSRASVFAPDLTFSRIISLPLRMGPVAVLSWPDSVVTSGISMTPSRMRLPLHLLDMSGSGVQIRRSFGDHQGELQPGDTNPLRRLVFAVRRTTFWTAEVLRFRFAEHSTDGRMLRQVHRAADWFREVPRGVSSPTIPPAPLVSAAAGRGDTLWVAISVPRPDWRRAWDGVIIPASGELTRQQAPEQTDLYMSRIEVIDLRSSRLVAHGSFRGLVAYLDENLDAIVYDLDFRGTPALTLMEVRLRRR